MFTMIPIPSVRYVYSLDMHTIPHRKDDDLKLIKYIDRLSKENYPSTASNVMSWRSEWDSHKKHREVMECFLGDMFRAYSDDIIFPHSRGREVVLIDSWLSVQRKGELIRRHDHYNNFRLFSFCYYLNMGENSAPIQIHEYHVPSPDGHVSDTPKEIYPREGTLLIFDGDLPHSVDTTTDDRFTIAGNVAFFDSKEQLIENENTQILSARKFFSNEN